MTIKHPILTLLAAALLTNCTTSNPNMITPPDAKKIPKKMTVHGDTRTDNYFWMRLTDEQKEAEKPDGQTQDVLDYLNAENDYLKKMLKHTEALQQNLFDEITGRIKQDDESVPYKKRGYTYYSRFEKGEDYPLYCRKKNTSKAQEEILLNGPEMGDGKSYFSIGTYSISTNNSLMAYSVDLVSRRE